MPRSTNRRAAVDIVMLGVVWISDESTLSIGSREPGLDARWLDNGLRRAAGGHHDARLAHAGVSVVYGWLRQLTRCVEARPAIPKRVLRRVRIALYCPVCGKWYWRGSHVDRMCEWLSATLDRPIEWPHDEPIVPA
jgi:hypothetical protein